VSTRARRSRPDGVAVNTSPHGTVRSARRRSSPRATSRPGARRTSAGRRSSRSARPPTVACASATWSRRSTSIGVRRARSIASSRPPQAYATVRPGGVRRERLRAPVAMHVMAAHAPPDSVATARCPPNWSTCSAPAGLSAVTRTVLSMRDRRGSRQPAGASARMSVPPVRRISIEAMPQASATIAASHSEASASAVVALCT
jgi:hypothetical protein